MRWDDCEGSTVCKYFLLKNMSNAGGICKNQLERVGVELISQELRTRTMSGAFGHELRHSDLVTR